mgnify:CR=1 FL=1
MKEIRNFVSFAPSSMQEDKDLSREKLIYLLIVGSLCLSSCILFQSDEIEFESEPSITLSNFSEIKENILKSSGWFLSFLKRNSHWKSRYDHNQLRITRIIECLRLLVGNDEADNFYKSVLELCIDSNINQSCLEYWKNA